MRRLSIALVVLTAALCLVPSGRAEDDAKTATAKITYVTGNSVYIEAGTEEGLNVGDTAQVFRGDQVIGTLEITFAAAHKSVAGRIAANLPVQLQDIVRFTPRFPMPPVGGAKETLGAGAVAPAPAPAEPVPAEPAPAPAKPRPVRRQNIRGRIGARFFTVKQRGDAEVGYQQPALEFRLDGTSLFGLPFDANVDVRARRTSRTRAGGPDRTETRARVYRAALSWQQTGGPLRVTAGRQFSPSFAMVSLFDGVAAEYRRPRWAAGVFSGSQPDPETMGLSSDVREHGIFAEYGSLVGAERRWLVTTGAVGSYERGEINREFTYVQARYDDRRLSLYGTTEVDVNRGWRKEAGESSFSRTGSYFSARYRLNDDWSIDAGADDRRNVRLYRDFVSPETEFDDAWRRGYWAGFDGRAGSHVRFGLSARSSSVEGGDSADSYTARVRVMRLTKLNLGVGVRSTQYDNTRLEGWLHSASVSIEPVPWTRIELRGGLRDETVKADVITEETHTWAGIDWDVYFGRHWLALFSYERNQGQDENTDQFYLTVNYRF